MVTTSRSSNTLLWDFVIFAINKSITTEEQRGTTVKVFDSGVKGSRFNSRLSRKIYFYSCSLHYCIRRQVHYMTKTSQSVPISVAPDCSYTPRSPLIIIAMDNIGIWLFGRNGILVLKKNSLESECLNNVTQRKVENITL